MKRIGLTAGALFHLDNGMAYTAPVTIDINREGEQYYSAKNRRLLRENSRSRRVLR